MIDIRETPQFSDWLRALRDERAKARIKVRILRMAEGNPGDVRPVGQGVVESCFWLTGSSSGGDRRRAARAA